MIILHYFISQKMRTQNRSGKCLKKTYPSWNPSDIYKRICARHFQRNNFVNYQQYNAEFAKKTRLREGAIPTNYPQMPSWVSNEDLPSTDQSTSAKTSIDRSVVGRRRRRLAGHLFQDRWKDQGRGFIFLPPWPPNCLGQMLTVRDFS